MDFLYSCLILGPSTLSSMYYATQSVVASLRDPTIRFSPTLRVLLELIADHRLLDPRGYMGLTLCVDQFKCQHCLWFG